MELRQLQLKELEILKTSLEIINRHHLRYFILGGTFLGAVRHKGFIPWDDDMDIAMPRNDYELFLKYAAEELESPYSLVTWQNTEAHNDFCARVVNANIVLVRNDARVEKKECLWVDFFPFDGMPSNAFFRGLHKIRLLWLRLLLQYSKYDTGINIKRKRPLFETVLIKIGFVISRIFPFNVKKRLLAVDKALRKYDYENSDYIINFMAASGFKELFPRKWFMDISDYDFEDLKLKGSSQYDKILTQMYGDYMTPPAADGHISHSIVTEVSNNG